jgi:hypothetical protein
MSLETSLKTIIDVLEKLGINPDSCQLPDSNGLGWAIPTEKSVLFLNLCELNGQTSLRLTCPILFIPTKEFLPFYRRMLDLNLQLADMALALDRDVVCLVNQQLVDGLVMAALENTIQRMYKSAALLADGLLGEFNSARFFST